MTVIDPSFVAAPVAPQPLGAALDQAISARRVEGFTEALARQGVGPVEVAQLEAPPAVDLPPAIAIAPPEATIDAGAVDRARRTLALEPAAVAAPGEAIVEGLKSLRSAFDGIEKNITSKLQTPGLDANGLIEVQMEVVRFSLLTDITSKLSGKSTQVLDTLMKGQ